MKKQQAINSINKTPETYLNCDQKLIAKHIINSAPEGEDVTQYYNFIMKKAEVGFRFDYSPEIAVGRIAVINEMPGLNIGISEARKENENNLIIGDNYEALKNLLLTHKKRIDVIYIDPPYNTEKAKEEGNKSSKSGKASKFIYRDKFGRNGWLNMMNERLELAKDLLSSTGVIFVSIDDSEQAYLKVLMDSIFGETNFIATIVWECRNPNVKLISQDHEYVIVFAKEINNIKADFQKKNIDGFNWSGRAIKRKRAEEGYVLNGISTKTKKKNPYRYKFNHKGVYEWKPNEARNVNEYVYGEAWTWSPKTMEKKISDGLIVFSESKGKLGAKFKDFNLRNTAAIKSVITKKEFKYSDNDLDTIIGKDKFPYPKPTEFIQYLLNTVLKNRKEAFVLDFFAGSGTTGHAVLELNRIDKGKRKFILVTNNENDIALKITYERLFRIINGEGTKGEKDFEWINEKKAYSNTPLRVFNIKHFDVRTNQSKNLEKITEFALKNLNKLNYSYKPVIGDAYYDLDGLNPLNEAQRRQVYSTDPLVHEEWKKVVDNVFSCTCGRVFKTREKLNIHIKEENKNNGVD